MKFVLFGAGFRAHNFLDFMGLKWAEAFLVSDKSDNRSDAVLPVIDIKEYKESFSQYPVLITPANEEEIICFLEENGVKEYHRLSDCPWDVQGYGDGALGFYGSYRELIKRYDGKVYIYGKTAFSLILMEELKHLGNDAELITEKSVNEVLGMMDKQDTILLTVRMGGYSCLPQDIKEKKIIDVLDHTTDHPHYFQKKNTLLHNKFDGKRCFIVATGPSIRIEDVNAALSQDAFVFGVNKTFLMEGLLRDFDCYLAVDRFLQLECRQEIADVKARYKFLGNRGDSYGEDDYILNMVVPDSLTELPRFSEDIAQKVYGGGTVVYAAIQVAAYMGFKEIYLLGVDCNYDPKRQTHFYKNEKEDKQYRNMGVMFRAFEAAKQYADTHGIRIYNATRGGMLEVFERVDLI